MLKLSPNLPIRSEAGLVLHGHSPEIDALVLVGLEKSETYPGRVLLDVVVGVRLSIVLIGGVVGTECATVLKNIRGRFPYSVVVVGFHPGRWGPR